MGHLNFLTPLTNENKRPDKATIFSGWCLSCGHLPWLPLVFSPELNWATLIKIHQCFGEIWLPERILLLLLQLAQDFSPFAAAQSPHADSSIKVIVIDCLGNLPNASGECGTWLVYSRLLRANIKKRLLTRNALLFGTVDMDQRAANVCNRQDAVAKKKRGGAL